MSDRFECTCADCVALVDVEGDACSTCLQGLEWGLKQGLLKRGVPPAQLEAALGRLLDRLTTRPREDG